MANVALPSSAEPIYGVLAGALSLRAAVAQHGRLVWLCSHAPDLSSGTCPGTRCPRISGAIYDAKDGNLAGAFTVAFMR